MPAGMFYRSPTPYKKKPLPNATKKVDIGQNKAIKRLDRKIEKINWIEELKHVDTEMTAVPFVQATAAGSIILLNSSTQGDTINQHDGDDIVMTSVQLRGAISRNILELGAGVHRMIMVYDKAPKGVAITFGEVLQAATLGTGANIVYAPYNTDYVGKRLKILMDKLYTLNPQVVETVTNPNEAPPTDYNETVMAYGPNQRIIKKKIRLNKKTIYGLGNAGTVADISIGSLYLLFISTELAAGAPPVFNGVARVIFKD